MGPAPDGGPVFLFLQKEGSENALFYCIDVSLGEALRFFASQRRLKIDKNTLVGVALLLTR
jgi:hypothetical protein